MSRMRVFPVILALCAACDSTTAPGGDDESTADAAVRLDAATPDGAAPSPDASTADPTALLEGVYAIRTVLATVDQTPGGEQNTTAYSYGVARIEPSSAGLTVTETWCRMVMENDGILEMSITDATTRAIPAVTVGLDISMEPAGLTVYRPEFPLPLGVELEDPIHDPLPTDADDPRIVDFEGDGNPGMSVHLSGVVSGSIYAIRRERYDYTVVRGGSGRLEGHTMDHGEQVIIGASNPLFEADTESHQNPNLALSTVTLVPLDDAPDCDALVTRIDTLF